ncbi:LacI family DNA-binding transcriptional regulator [Brevundimonas bacteroides]|uniref:LacI family DNA-binding transcriptional regulator n=1 Tax=Brevundimonas bacteroides TaxID=74311 RepID=UPI0004971A9D|nr:LacI family DNA-binding transcriptional regulator [Brevundimonas bacteroides]
MKAATIRDVAERAGVSVASVSRVLTGAGVVAEPTRSKVLEAVEALSYVPHSGARSLSTSRTDVIGVILPDLFGEFFSELIRGMDVACRAQGRHLIVSSSHDDAANAAAAIRSMRGRVDGLIVLSPHLDSGELTSSLSGRLPVLLMNGGDLDGQQPSMAVDNTGGARVAVEHLFSLGRRRIAHVGGPTGNLEARQRKQGYLDAVASAGAQPMLAQGEFTQASGFAAAARLLASDQRPDAIFAGNDAMAVGVLLAIQEAGLRCPEDIAVVGFDDVPIAELVRPGLTTLHIDIAGMGRRAVERLLTEIDDAAANSPQAANDAAREIIVPRLVVRQSCGASTSTQGFSGERP